MLGRLFNKRPTRIIKPSDISDETVSELRSMTNSVKYGKAIMMLHNAMVENYSHIYGTNNFEELGAFNVGILAGLAVSRDNAEFAREYFDFLNRSVKIIGADSQFNKDGSGPAATYIEGLRDFIKDVIEPIIRDSERSNEEGV